MNQSVIEFTRIGELKKKEKRACWTSLESIHRGFFSFFFFQFCDAIAKLVIIHKEDLAKFEWIWEFKESFWYFGYLLEPIVEIRQLCILFMKKEMWWIRATILLTKNPVYLLKSCFFFKLKKRRKFTKRENTGLYSFDI
jgi:hypothetical protein